MVILEMYQLLYQKKRILNSMSQISTKEKKLYCSHCKGSPTIEIPNEVDVSLPSSNEFVENIRCTICKEVGYVRR